MNRLGQYMQGKKLESFKEVVLASGSYKVLKKTVTTDEKEEPVTFELIKTRDFFNLLKDLGHVKKAQVH